MKYYIIVSLSLMLAVSAYAQESVGFVDLNSMNKCLSDADWLSSYEHCSPEYNIWQHKYVLPITPTELIGAFTLLATIALCNAAGIGGGELVVAILIVFFQFSTKSSAVLSNVCIFIASFCRFVMNLKQKNPERNATSVDYDIVTLMLPVVLLGTFIGVQLNIIIPNTILLVILTLLLVFLSVKTSLKARQMFTEETKAKTDGDERLELQENPRIMYASNTITLDRLDALDFINQNYQLNNMSRKYSGNREALLEDPEFNSSESCDEARYHQQNMNSSQGGNSHKKGTAPSPPDMNLTKFRIEDMKSIMIWSFDGNKTRILKRVKKQERTHLQITKLLPIAILFFLLILVSFLRDSHKPGVSAAVERCSAEDWTLLLTFIGVGLLITIISVIRLKRGYAVKQLVGYVFVLGDIRWEDNTIIQMLFTGLWGGILSGMVGLGGGVIFNPLLLEFGVNPLVSSATGMYMVMLATLSSSILFTMEGRMLYDYAIFFGIFMWVATYIGIKVVDKAIKKYGRPSILVLILAGVIVLGTIITPALGIFQVIHEYEMNQDLFTFSSYC